MTPTKNTTWNQKLYSARSLKAEINYTFKDARKHKTSHKVIQARLKERVYENAQYTTLPMYMRSEIGGYIEANFQIMHEFLEFAHWYDGKFVGKNLVYDSNFKRELINKSAHVYIGTEICYS